MDQLYGGFPPEAVSVSEYGFLTSPSGKDGELYIINGAEPGEPIVTEKPFEVMTPAESATCTVKLKFPLAVGVPLRTPLVEMRVIPGGDWPAVIDQV